MLGLTPLHDGTDYTTYTISPDQDEGWNWPQGVGVSTFFVEGEFAELFPNLDPADSLPLDIGFAVGRQFIDLQDGMLVNDTIDSVGLVKNNLMFPGVTNLRLTGLFGWGQVHRNDNSRDEDAHLWAASAAWDTFSATYEADVAYVEAPEDATSQGDSIHVGLGAIQRIGGWNTGVRALYSNSTETDSAGADDGVLLFAETSTSPTGHVQHSLPQRLRGIGRLHLGRPRAGGPAGRWDVSACPSPRRSLATTGRPCPTVRPMWSAALSAIKCSLTAYPVS